jgi:hypothetical protein
MNPHRRIRHAFEPLYGHGQELSDEAHGWKTDVMLLAGK